MDWDGSSLSAYTDTPANRDLAAKFLKEGTLAHDLGSYATKDGDVFTVNVEGWLASKNLTEQWLNANVKMGSDASAKMNAMGDWLANYLGVETAANVSGNVGVDVSYTTKTSDGTATSATSQSLLLISNLQYLLGSSCQYHPLSEL